MKTVTDKHAELTTVRPASMEHGGKSIPPCENIKEIFVRALRATRSPEGPRTIIMDCFRGGGGKPELPDTHARLKILNLNGNAIKLKFYPQKSDHYWEGRLEVEGNLNLDDEHQRLHAYVNTNWDFLATMLEPELEVCRTFAIRRQFVVREFLVSLTATGATIDRAQSLHSAMFNNGIVVRTGTAGHTQRFTSAGREALCIPGEVTERVEAGKLPVSVSEETAEIGMRLLTLGEEVKAHSQDEQELHEALVKINEVNEELRTASRPFVEKIGELTRHVDALKERMNSQERQKALQNFNRVKELLS